MILLRKTIFSLAALVGLSSCTEEQEYDSCMDEVSVQTATPKEALAGLTCEDLLQKLYLPLPHDYLTLKDKNAVFFTHCSLNYNGTFHLQQNQYCYEKINDFLGIQPITKCLMEAMDFENGLVELKSMYVPRGAAGCFMISSGWLGEKKECQETDDSLIEVDGCAPHEPTHIFVAGTVLHRDPPWLNEGLADYVMIKLRPNDMTLECLPGSFKYVFKDSYTGELKKVTEGDYISLDEDREDYDKETQHRAYLTGACLWQHIDSVHGHETFKAIMQDVNASRFRYTSFVNDILLSHIGESGIDDLKNKFGEDSVEVFE